MSPPTAQTNGPAQRQIQSLLDLSDRVSDLIFVPGQPPQAQIDGELREQAPPPPALAREDTQAVADALLADHEFSRKRFVEQGTADFSFRFQDRCYFRASIFQARQGVSIVLRVIPIEVPTLEGLRLPARLADIARSQSGLVLVSGATGSGKSSTLAAMIRLINSERAVHVATIEDPVEFVHTPIKATITQRQIGSDVPTYADGLRAALRQAPQVILVGEIRDAQTAEIVFEAAETGHLVFSTLHAPDTIRTVERVLGLFTDHDTEYVRLRFARAFKSIISQKLLPRKDGAGRVPVVEILNNTLRTQEYIRLGNRPGKELEEALEDGAIEGMQSFDQELERLARENAISLPTALAHATNRGNLELRLLSDQEPVPILARDEVFLRLKKPPSTEPPRTPKPSSVVMPLRPRKARPRSPE